MNRLFHLVLSSLRQTRPYALYQLARSGYLRQHGWLQSVRAQRSVDYTGRPIPWITYPCLEFMERRINKRMSVFEYGSGNSTLWWSERVGKVVSCEHDSVWYREMKKHAPSNVEFRHVPLENEGEYSREILKYPGQFEIVIVDGRDRVNCLKNAPVALRDDGVILLDNSDRGEYEEGLKFLSEKGYRKLDFYGLGPIVTFSTCTSIFYRTLNCLGV